MKRPAVLAALTVLLLSGCTKQEKLSMTDAFPVVDAAPAVGQPVLLLAAQESFEQKAPAASFRADPTYLGKMLSKFLAFGPLPLIPFTVEFAEYRADVARTQLLSDAVSARLKQRGIPSEPGEAEADGRPRGLAKGRLALTTQLRGTEAVGKQSFMCFISVSGTALRGVTTRASVDCRLWRGGEDKPVWEGRVTGEHVSNSGWADAKTFAQSYAAAADSCIESSGLARLRAAGMASSFNEHIEKGQYAQAYGEAATLEQALAAAQGLRNDAGKPVPEAARDLMARGKAAAGMAASPADFESASAAMEKAVALAPWWASGHFNTALAEEGAGRWPLGVKHLKLYLALKPDAEDKEAVRLKIAELEYRQQRGDKAAGASIAQ